MAGNTLSFQFTALTKQVDKRFISMLNESVNRGPDMKEKKKLTLSQEKGGQPLSLECERGTALPDTLC
jgi:hypothetical protein